MSLSTSGYQIQSLRSLISRTMTWEECLKMKSTFGTAQLVPFNTQVAKWLKETFGSEENAERMMYSRDGRLLRSLKVDYEIKEHQFCCQLAEQRKLSPLSPDSSYERSCGSVGGVNGTCCLNVARTAYKSKSLPSKCRVHTNRPGFESVPSRELSWSEWIDWVHFICPNLCPV